MHLLNKIGNKNINLKISVTKFKQNTHIMRKESTEQMWELFKQTVHETIDIIFEKIM